MIFHVRLKSSGFQQAFFSSESAALSLYPPVNCHEHRPWSKSISTTLARVQVILRNRGENYQELWQRATVPPFNINTAIFVHSGKLHGAAP